MPDGDGHSLTFADGRPRVVAGEILVRSLKTERFALRSALQEVTTHDGPAPNPDLLRFPSCYAGCMVVPKTGFGASKGTSRQEDVSTVPMG